MSEQQPDWTALAEQAITLGNLIGENDEAARDSAYFIGLRLSRLADREGASAER